MADEELSQELEQELFQAGVFESEQEARHREDVLAELHQLLNSWVKQVAESRGLDEQLIHQAKALMFPFGSYRLGVHEPGADIDTLCVGPEYVSREFHFFEDLYDILLDNEKVAEVQRVTDAHVPVMKFKISGISIDLLYARLSSPTIPEVDFHLSASFSHHISNKNFEPLDNVTLVGLDEKSILSLNGIRDTNQILRLVPNVQHFRTALRCIRFWARRRGVYSKVTGFLGGVNCALLVGYVCVKHPTALPSLLVANFFRTFSQWHWPDPVTLDTNSSSTWDPGRNRMQQMVILTPVSCVNSSHTASTSTLSIMLQEFDRGVSVCKDIMIGRQKWRALFEEFAFFNVYRNYIQLDVVAADSHDHLCWKGWVESRLRQLVLKIEKDTHGLVRCHPYPYDPFAGNNRCSMFVGLRALHGVSLHFNMCSTVEEFKRCVEAYGNWKPGMRIFVSRVSAERKRPRSPTGLNSTTDEQARLSIRRRGAS